MVKKRLQLSAFLLYIGGIFFFTHHVSAQELSEDIGISLSPVKFEFEGAPGDILEGEIKYYNYTSTEKIIYLRNYNFESIGESNVPAFIYSGLEPYNTTLKDWIKLDQTEIIVDPVEPVRIHPTIVKFQIEIPEDASPGGYYAAVIQSQRSLSTEELKSSGTVISPESACLFILNVTGDVTRLGTSESFYVTNPYDKDKKPLKLFEFPPVQFIARIRNSGNSHFKPQGNIFLYKGKRQIASYQVNEGEGAILRDSVRMFEEEVWGEDTFLLREPKMDENGEQILDKKGNVKTTLKINWDKLSKIPFGKYRAKLSLVYDNNNQKKTIEDEIVFWIIPWRFLLVIITLICGIIGLYLYKKSREKGVQKYHD